MAVDVPMLRPYRLLALSSDLGVALAHGDRFGQSLLIADALQFRQGFVESGAQPATGGEGGRQMPHALDDADGVVMYGVLRIAAIVRHPVEHREQHSLEHHARHIGTDAAVHAETETVVPIAP